MSERFPSGAVQEALEYAGLQLMEIDPNPRGIDAGVITIKVGTYAITLLFSPRYFI